MSASPDGPPVGSRWRVLDHLWGLLSPKERKNGWQLAEQAGTPPPTGCGVCRPSTAGMPTWFAMTCGVFLAYASAKGGVLLDRELYLPQMWSGGRERRREAGGCSISSHAATGRSIGNQHEWDSLRAERSGVIWRSGELHEGRVIVSSPFDHPWLPSWLTRRRGLRRRASVPASPLTNSCRCRCQDEVFSTNSQRKVRSKVRLGPPRAFTLGQAMSASEESSDPMIRISVQGRITEDHVNACVAILRSLPEWFGDAKAVSAYLNDLPTLDTYLAQRDMKVVGFAAVQRKSAHVADVHVMGVARKERRRGVGRALVSQIVEDLASLGVKLLGAIDGVGTSQHVAITVADGGTLEYYPGLTIPYPDAIFEQSLEVALHPGSRIGLLEMWAMGRIERGESLRFGSIDSRTRVSIDGRSAYADALVLRPGETALDGFGLLEGNQYTVAGFWHWGDDRPLVEPAGAPGLTLVTGRPSTGTAYVRGMGSDGVSLHTAVRNVLSAQRAAWGLTRIDFRRHTSAFG